MLYQWFCGVNESKPCEPSTIADDTLSFLNFHDKKSKKLKEFIDVFELAFGLKINREKIAISGSNID